MNQSWKLRTPIIWLILVATASGCSGTSQDDPAPASNAAASTTPTPDSPKIMTDEQATEVYLKALCPVAHLLKEGNSNVKNYQAWKTIAVKLGKAAEMSAKVLHGDSSTVWPPAIADDVDTFIDVLLEDNATMNRLESTGKIPANEEQFWSYQNQWADARSPVAEKRIRLELGLDTNRDQACETAGL